MFAKRTLLLVRHGLPDYRAHQAGDEPPGPPLSGIGTEQARQAAVTLAGCEAAAIHCSPLARARQTAEQIRVVLPVPLMIESDLKEWHRTESLYAVNQRGARWLVRWLTGDESCAVVVGHASPLLGILRTALYLPHVGWYKTGRPNQLQLNSSDRLELSMGSILVLTIEPDQVTAELVFHPNPRIMDAYQKPILRCLPRPVWGHGENTYVRRPNLLHLSGYRSSSEV